MFTIFSEEKEAYVKVEEPDYSLTYTYADYMRWRYEERLELIRGKIFKMSGPNTAHQLVSGNIFAAFHTFLRRKTCRVFAAPYDIRLPFQNKTKDEEITTVVQPDICVICDESKIEERGCCGAPDLVVEIISPGNTRKDVQTKYELYEEFGVKEYWIVHPTKKIITVHIQEEAGKFERGKRYTEGDWLESHAVPGFKIEVSEIFTR